MLMRIVRLSLLFVAILTLSADRAAAMGEILGQTKEELQLKYDVTVRDYGNGRVGIEFTLTDDGRLKPIEAVELEIVPQDKNKDGSYSPDLSVPIELKKTPDGKRVARFELRKDLADRAQIWLTTNTFDGKALVMTRYHFIISLVPYLKNAAVRAAKPAAPADGAAPAPPATEGKKD